MKKLIIFLFVSLFFCCNESSKNISEYELIENWAKIPDDYILGNPTGVALTSNQNLVVFHRGSRSWQVPMPKEKIIEAINGPRGGYRIKAKLNNINLVEFFEKVEGPLGLSDCFYDASCMQIKHCNIRTPIQRINDNMINMFRSMSVKDVTN